MGCGVGSGRQWERWTVGQRRLLFVVGPGWALRRPWWWVVGAVVGGQAQMNEKVPEGGTRLVWVTARGGLPQKGAVLDALAGGGSCCLFMCQLRVDKIHHLELPS